MFFSQLTRRLFLFFLSKTTLVTAIDLLIEFETFHREFAICWQRTLISKDAWSRHISACICSHLATVDADRYVTCFRLIWELHILCVLKPIFPNLLWFFGIRISKIPLYFCISILLLQNWIVMFRVLNNKTQFFLSNGFFQGVEWASMLATWLDTKGTKPVPEWWRKTVISSFASRFLQFVIGL